MSAAPPLAAAAREVRAGVAVAALLSLATMACVLVVPLYDMHVLDRVLVSRSVETLVALSLFCVAGLVLYGLVTAIRGVLLAALAERLSQRLAAPVLEAGMRAALAGDPAAAARALAALQSLRHFFAGGAAAAPFDLLLAPLGLLALFLLHPALGWYGLGAAAALLAFALAIEAVARPRIEAGERLRAQALWDVGALLRQQELVGALGLAGAVERRWNRRGGAAARVLHAAGARADGWSALALLVRALLQGGMIALAALLVLRHEATPAALVGANITLALALGPLDQLLQNWRAALAARSAWRELAALLGQGPPPAVAPPDERAPPGLLFRGVTHTPPGAARAVLDGLDLHVAPGELVAVVGPNGAGKSCLARLAAGVLAPDAGRVTVAGEAAVAAAAAGRVGYLPQRPQLLAATVAETLGRFRPAEAGPLLAVAQAVRLHEAIGQLPQGYATPLQPEDPRMSGGQRQRLALGRALFGHPPVLVLDEPDASLDAEGEAAAVEALGAACAAGAAVLVVTHRQALLRAAHRVLRLEAGRLHPA